MLFVQLHLNIRLFYIEFKIFMSLFVCEYYSGLCPIDRMGKPNLTCLRLAALRSGIYYPCQLTALYALYIIKEDFSS